MKRLFGLSLAGSLLALASSGALPAYAAGTGDSPHLAEQTLAADLTGHPEIDDLPAYMTAPSDRLADDSVATASNATARPETITANLAHVAIPVTSWFDSPWIKALTVLAGLTTAIAAGIFVRSVRP